MGARWCWKQLGRLDHDPTAEAEQPAAKVDVMLHAPTRQDELHRIRTIAIRTIVIRTIVHIPHPRHHRSQPDRRHHQPHRQRRHPPGFRRQRRHHQRHHTHPLGHLRGSSGWAFPWRPRHCTRPGTIRPSVASILQRAAIGMKRPIGAHQQQRFTDRLGHQQAVKRITVMESSFRSGGVPVA